MSKQLIIMLAMFLGSLITSHAQEVIMHTSATGENIAEVMPCFPGGDDARDAFINKTKEYQNEEDKQTGVGSVQISFHVEEDGSIDKIKVVKSLSKYYDKEAIRIIKAMPDWKPAIYNEEPEETKVTIFIKF